MKHFTCGLMLLWAIAPARAARSPLVRVVDLNVGQSQTVTLADGKQAAVTLLEVQADRDTLRSAVRRARVRIEVNGEPATLVCSTYHLPRTVAGMRIDCPIVKSYLPKEKPDKNVWALAADARLRLWPADGPLIAPDTFVYPVKQRWFASDTQMCNEPVFVDRGECPLPKEHSIYYHNGLDFGGAEGMVEVVSAVDGLVVAAGKEVLPEHNQAPVSPRYDVVYLQDERGWYYRYSHLQKIDPAIQPGRHVRMGQRVGVLGKEGASGGWSHLHFAIFGMQPSGQWGVMDAYVFAWDAYQRQYHPKLLAVARPHQVAWTGETITLDAGKSWSASGGITRYEWTFTDGATAAGPMVEKTYTTPGCHSEILKITDAAGEVAYDFAVVQVMDKDHPEWCIPTIHAVYAPTLQIRPGDPVTFKVRTFGTTAGSETWDFGDGSAPAQTCSDGNVEPLNPHGYAATVHTYAKPGDYLVRVQRTDEHGTTATARLWIPVQPKH